MAVIVNRLYRTSSCDNNTAMVRRRLLLPLLFIATLVSGGCARPDTSTLTVSVAASLQDAMEQLGPAFEQAQPGTKVSFNFGGSGTLAQQIEHGAPADVFFSAATKQMNELAAKGIILNDTRRDLLRNQVVLIAGAGNPGLNSFASLVPPAVKLISLGDPGSVPAGEYGRQVLESLGLWQAVQGKLVLAKDVRQVLTYVETGNADAGIVYATDARLSGKVRVVATAPESSHAPVVYPIAVVKGSRNVAASRAFVKFLEGAHAREVFARLGFTPASS
jgi:molybdate transport system substrate-binding protein